MKKLLLSLFAVAATFGAYAAEPTVADFGEVESFQGEAGKTATVGGIEFTFETANAYVGLGYSGAPNYVMLKNAAPAGAISFTLPFDCYQIVLSTTSGCSTGAGNTVTLTAGEEIVVENKAINAQNADFTFALDGFTTAGTKYTFTASGSKNSQIAKLTFYPVTSEASISIEEKSLSFVTALNGTQALSFKVNSNNLTEDIAVASDNAAFVVSAASVTEEAAAAGIEVSFTGSSTETVSGTITVSANGVSASIPVEGFAVAHAGTETDPLTVNDVLTMASRNNGEFYVKGVIGALTANNGQNGMVTEVADESKNVATNIILKEGDDMIGVALPSGDARTALNIVDNPENVGKTVIVCGTLENYFSAPGVKNTKYVSGLEENGINAVESVENAPVEYFNLQGVRVANPENGLYIRRQGNTVTKVLVK